VEENATGVVSGWCHDEELALCPRCGDKRLTPPSPSMAGMRVCLTCGVIVEPKGS
jgi:DNA-directed RNA polymerase subunit RPC12/RpoP